MKPSRSFPATDRMGARKCERAVAVIVVSLALPCCRDLYGVRRQLSWQEVAIRVTSELVVSGRDDG